MTGKLSLARLRPRDRRALLLGACIGAPALAWAFAVQPYIATMRADRATLETQRSLLARERGAIDAAPRTPREIQRVRAALDRERARLFEGDAISSGAALTSYVKDAIEENSLTLQQLDARESATLPSGLRDLTLELRAEGDLRGILDMLTALENGERLVRVARVAIERSAAPPNATTEALVLTATLHGYAESEQPTGVLP